MKINIAKNVLVDILRTNASITKSDSYNPILNCVYISAKKNQIKCIYSNGTISIQNTLTEGFEILEEGSILIKNKFLLDIVAKVSEKTITLEKYENTVCNLSTSFFKCQINIMDESIYPNISFNHQNFNKIELLNKDLNKITTKIASCVATGNEINSIITGIGFEYNSNKKILNVSGTNSFKLATLSIPLENSESFSFIMELNVAKLLNLLIASQLDNDKKTELFINQETNEIVFQVNNITVMAKNIEGKFVEVSKFFNNLGDQSFEIDKCKLIAALERGITFVSNDKVAQVILNISGSNLKVDFSSYELGTSQEVIEIQNKIGTDGNIVVNAKYLISILKNVENEIVKFNFFYEIRPIILTDPKDPSFKQLILPIRGN